MRDDFAVFILTHGRADTVLTKKALDAQGYTGKIYYVVDNEDDQIERYKANFGAESVSFKRSKCLYGAGRKRA